MAEEAQKAAADDISFFNTVIAGSLEEAERMILSGVSASCVDDQLRTPLHYAAYNGDRDMAALLCDYDADIEAFDASVRSSLMLRIHISAKSYVLPVSCIYIYIYIYIFFFFFLGWGGGKGQHRAARFRCSRAHPRYFFFSVRGNRGCAE